MSGKIVFVSPFAYPLLSQGKKGTGAGGAERQFYLLAKQLQKQNENIAFITSRAGETFLQQNAEFPVYFADFDYLGGSKSRLLSNWKSLGAAMRQADGQFYILKTPAHLLAPLHFFASSQKRKLIFWSQMNYDASPELRTSMHWAASKLQDWGMRRADLVIAQTRAQQADFSKKYGIESQYVPSICSFAGAMAPESRKEFDILWVGNSSAKKRQEIIFYLAAQMPELNFAVVMNRSDWKRYEQAAQESARQSNVRFFGEIPPEEVEALFSRSRLYLNTSAMEGFPNTFLQAWMHRLPVFSLGIDPDSVIQKLGLGEVFEWNNSETSGTALVRRLRYWMESVLVRDRAGNAAANYVVANHAPEQVAAIFLKVLTTLR